MDIINNPIEANIINSNEIKIMAFSTAINMWKQYKEIYTTFNKVL